MEQKYTRCFLCNKMIWIIIITGFLAERHVIAEEAILMDTRTAISDIGWAMSPGSDWTEANGPHPDGRDRRMLVVCQIKKPHQNNWARTPYIPVDGAERIYVEFEFTIRSCEDVPNVATCKETFNLYYYETDRDEATSTFPPWREGAYIKVDTIAADKRFKPGSAERNFETRDIGPLTKRGVYLAIQDTGACMALMHVRVYYKYCAPTESNLANFGRTTAGPYMASLVEANGTCVDNSLADNDDRATFRCNSEGEWIVPKGSCLCDRGYGPDYTSTSCQECGRGFYKSSVGNGGCVRCPAYSESQSDGSTECQCMPGYYRALSDDAAKPCSQPPSKPVNVLAIVNQTKITLTWERPFNDGGRDDITYRIECQRCQVGFDHCAPCPQGVDFEPRQRDLVVTKVVVRDLSSYAYYRFKIFAINGVTWVAQLSPSEVEYAEVTVETNEAAPSMVLGVRVTDLSETSAILTWDTPAKVNGLIRSYVVSLGLVYQGQVTDIRMFNSTSKRSMRLDGLKQNNMYAVKVRASTDAGFGPYSVPLKFSPLESTTSSPNTNDHVGTIQLIIAVIGGCSIVIAIVLIVFCCRRKSHQNKSKLDMEKLPMFVMGHLKNGSIGYMPGHKTYIDPTTYEDPARAVLDFTKEIDASYIGIEEVIGGGEFGEVCLGRMRLPNSKKEHDVAIKTLKAGYSTQQKLDFLGEASIMGQFDHPNVIRLEGVVTKSQPHMIITEYMENGSLDTFLRKHDGEFTVIQLVGILRNIAAGMKYLSDMGYVHRDLAARNILVNAQLICKVSDFGLSRVLEESSDSTYTTRGGKIPIRWTAPEAINYRKFTSASDVWSYGIVMWEVMSYGERPYWGMSNQDVIHAVGTGYRLPAPMDCPQVQHKLMLDCWKKDRNERPKFSQVVATLDRMIREPEQLKVIAGHDKNRNGCLLNERGSLRRPSFQGPNGISETMTLLMDDRTRCTSLLRHQVPSSLGVWLDGLGLGNYKENFVSAGYSSLDQVLQMSPSDLASLGIVETNQQNAVMESISSIRYKTNPGRKPPQYRDERITGIPV
uniref:receptor protein-tyrosine kinase n=1 Tax=Ciona intestinalis TaxID=7719 RepID=F6ZVC5_CIOIN